MQKVPFPGGNQLQYVAFGVFAQAFISAGQMGSYPADIFNDLHRMLEYVFINMLQGIMHILALVSEGEVVGVIDVSTGQFHRVPIRSAKAEMGKDELNVIIYHRMPPCYILKNYSTSVNGLSTRTSLCAFPGGTVLNYEFCRFFARPRSIKKTYGAGYFRGSSRGIRPRNKIRKVRRICRKSPSDGE